MITAIPSLIVFNTLREDGFFPQSSPPLLAGEIREREEAVIYLQPVSRRRTRQLGQARLAAVRRRVRDPRPQASGPALKPLQPAIV